MSEQETNIENKLKTIGFKNFNLVIDAACGSGNWGSSLSRLNNNVLGYDSYKESIIEANRKHSNISNLYFAIANLVNPPIKNDAADAIVCADSLMFANPILVLNSFNKQLKKNGLVYISVNGLGWILNCFLVRGIKNRDFSKINMSVRIIFDTIIRKYFDSKFPVKNTVYTLKELKYLALETGFEVVHADFEGTYLNSENKHYQPLFERKFLGITQSLEIILRKRG